MNDGFYKHPLPSPPAIDFVSEEGKQLFREAIENGTMEGFYKLISTFQTQSELCFCGLASLSIVLNALAIDPGRRWKGPWRWFDESMLRIYTNIEKVKGGGIVFGDLASLAGSAGAKVEFFYASENTIEDFRKYVIKCSSSDHCHIIASYYRSALKQIGGGHYSPIGGYHCKKDKILILDVARYKYPPHWVPLQDLWEGMNCIDECVGLSRG
ncbi:glutathione gamma-glutamylcysteinyltransferase 1 [Cajanus cajan]|uniref:glutathione gamma-glutamylcysteinyltransferase 1 n=1 Tax=Cajanus cajan TaxID=3821 RepID=UPI0010FB9C0F|nr:glutathione gamma-glutamylcysteinyltransferase 1 [Cajanus cajan]